MTSTASSRASPSGSPPALPPDVVLAISRGGLVPAGMLAYRMGWRNMLVGSVVVYDDDGRMGDARFLEFPPDDRLTGKRVRRHRRGLGLGYDHRRGRRAPSEPPAGTR